MVYQTILTVNGNRICSEEEFEEELSQIQRSIDQDIGYTILKTVVLMLQAVINSANTDETDNMLCLQQMKAEDGLIIQVKFSVKGDLDLEI